MRKTLLAVSVALISCAATAQDEVGEQPSADEIPAANTGTAWTNMDGRFFVSPMLTYTFIDSGRNVESGLGGSLAVGRAFGPFGFELSAQYSKLDSEAGDRQAEINGLGINTLLFPSKKRPGYALLGAAYGDVKDHPGGASDYNALMLQLGGGYLWQPLEQRLPGLLLRTEAIYRLDAHGDNRTGETVGNGRKAFNDVLLGVGLTIPVGGKPAPMVAPALTALPVAVVPVVDADGDGVADEADQCPDSPAGAAVNPQGCPADPAEAAPAPVPVAACTAYEVGAGFDIASCKVGDVLLLKGVNFETNQARLTATAKETLVGVSAALATSAASVEIAGHTDSQGSEALNQRLSQSRACTVARQLTSEGIAADRLSPVGYGGNQSVADNATEEGRAQNRRVELKVIEFPGSGLAACGDNAAASKASQAPSVAAVPEEGAGDVPAEVVTDPATDSAPSEPVAEELTAPAASEAPTLAADLPAEAPQAAAPASVAPASAATAPAQVQMVPEEEVFGR